MKVVKFTKPNGQYNSGDVAGFEDHIADQLIEIQVAKEFKEKPAKKEPSKESEKEEVEETKEESKEEKPKQPPKRNVRRNAKTKPVKQENETLQQK